MSMPVCMYACMYVCKYVCICMNMYVCMYVQFSLVRCIHTYMHITTYVRIANSFHGDCIRSRIRTCRHADLSYVPKYELMLPAIYAAHN